MRQSTVTLSDFEIVLPRHEVSQEDSRRWICERHLASARLDSSISPESVETLERVFLRYAIKPELIARRFFECPDIAHPEMNPVGIYGIDKDHLAGADIARRTALFSDRATEVFGQLYAKDRADLAHIVHVTCTGYRSPSAAQLLIARKGWGQDVGVSHAYHMGCYAALPAIRIARGLVAAQGSEPLERHAVDIVHNEMCGLHMNASAHSPEQIVVQSLFADGHVKYTARPSARGLPGLKVLAIQEEVVTDTDADMSWAPQAWGLQMNLAREVPAKIGAVIETFFGRMAASVGLNADELRANATFAIHPGGPRIIQSVQENLGLSDEQTRLSKKVLRERGNMSSATLPHVWNEILAEKPAPGTLVVSFAFGPGLTVFGAIFEVV